jgi:hypothetical protein
MSMLIDKLEEWANDHAAALAAKSIQLSVTHSQGMRDKESAWIDIDSLKRSVRLIIWESGEATLSVGDLSTGTLIAEEQLEITSEFGLEQAVGSALAWATGELHS